MRTARTRAGFVFVAGVVLVAAVIALGRSGEGEAARGRYAAPPLPADPVRVELLAAPGAGRMALRVDCTEALSGTTLRLVALPAGTRDAEVIGRGVLPAGLDVTAGRPMTMRGLTVLPLVIRGAGAGIEGSAALAGKAAVAGSAEIEIALGAAEPAAPAAASRAFAQSAGFFTPFRDLFPAAQRAALETTAEGGYLVITPPEMAATIEPFLAWKRELGYAVQVATTAETGTSNTQIQAYVRNVYATSPVPPQYLLLIGDLDRVPSFDFHGVDLGPSVQPDRRRRLPARHRRRPPVGERHARSRDHRRQDPSPTSAIPSGSIRAGSGARSSSPGTTLPRRRCRSCAGRARSSSPPVTRRWIRSTSRRTGPPARR